jgi:hypothetical protein
MLMVHTMVPYGADEFMGAARASRAGIRRRRRGSQRNQRLRAIPDARSSVLQLLAPRTLESAAIRDGRS